MAGEATWDIETHIPINFSKGSGLIPKGSLCKMAGAMVASIADGDGDVVAGIAQSDALTGDSSVAIFRGGVFRMLAEGTITAGDAVITGITTGSANAVLTAGINAENILGTALNDATDGGLVMIELLPRGINLA
jgi:hypothetical protein